MLTLQDTHTHRQSHKGSNIVVSSRRMLTGKCITVESGAQVECPNCIDHLTKQRGGMEWIRDGLLGARVLAHRKVLDLNMHARVVV